MKCEVRRKEKGPMPQVLSFRPATEKIGRKERFLVSLLLTLEKNVGGGEKKVNLEK